MIVNELLPLYCGKIKVNPDKTREHMPIYLQFVKRDYLLVLLLVCSEILVLAQPIQQHPDNPHYFLYREKPTVLVTSAEHYGAVINASFDYEKYLSTLERIGLNHTRIFLGDYFEKPTSFGILTNTLAPDPNSILAPWQRSSEHGYVRGGNKFDLDKWDESYFARLKDFMDLAEKKGIIVETVLFFTSLVDDTSPLYGKNNINGMPAYSMNDYRTLADHRILSRQKLYCQKIVETLNPYDNLIINIINEPWFFNQISGAFGSPPPVATNEWIQKVSEWIVETEKNLPKKHLISTDYSNEGVEMPKDHLETYFENIAVFNHHYDAAAESVIKNYDRTDRVWSFNETGIMPTSSPEYRIQGWKYLMNGGALYNNLDFTYQVGDEDGHGTTLFDGGHTRYMACTDHDVKYQMARLLEFWNQLDFVNMKPGEDCISFEYGHVETHGFYQEGQTYVVYFIGAGQPVANINISNGKYKVEWIDPRTLQPLEDLEIFIENGSYKLVGPGYLEDIVAKVTRIDQ